MEVVAIMTSACAKFVLRVGQISQFQKFYCARGEKFTMQLQWRHCFKQNKGRYDIDHVTRILSLLTFFKATFWSGSDLDQPNK